MAITTSTNKLKVTELDFDDIKAALKDFLGGQTEFTDYNFESSGMAVLLDILAYNTHYNAFYTNMLASEMFIDSAAIRSNVVSRAKQLGYIPASKKGAEAVVDITISGVTSGASEITVPKGFKCASRIGGSTYTFITTETVTAQQQSSDRSLYYASNVTIREGVSLINSQQAIGSENELFTIPNVDADTRALAITVNGEAYNFADDYTEVSASSKVYFLQEGDDELYQVYFGDGSVGKAISVDDIVTINYSISRIGVEGNAAREFVAAETLAGTIPTVALSSSDAPASGGGSKETTSSIKRKAPRGFELQKRVVTAEDYKARLINDYPAIDTIRVWGGEENDPPEYGKVFISINPVAGYSLSDSEKLRIKNDILQKRNVVTISPVFVDPEFIYLVLDVEVVYDPRATTQTSAQLKTLATAAITGFALTDLHKFENFFRHSNLLKRIDDVNVAIKNCSIGVKVRKYIIPTLNTSLDYDIKFYNELYHPHGGHMPVITSTTFNHSGYGNCYLEDADGIVRVVTKDSETGEKIFVNRAAGTIDYVTGRIYLENFTPTAITDETTSFTVTAIPKNVDIIPKESSILTISDTDLLITMKDDTLLTRETSSTY